MLKHNKKLNDLWEKAPKIQDGDLLVLKDCKESDAFKDALIEDICVALAGQ